MAISKEEIKRVKGQGFLLNRGTERFSARVITENGVLSAAQLSEFVGGGAAVRQWKRHLYHCASP